MGIARKTTALKPVKLTKMLRNLSLREGEQLQIERDVFDEDGLVFLELATATTDDYTRGLASCITKDGVDKFFLEDDYGGPHVAAHSSATNVDTNRPAAASSPTNAALDALIASSDPDLFCQIDPDTNTNDVFTLPNASFINTLPEVPAIRRSQRVRKSTRKPDFAYY
ncbi:Oidioi.mRNA.OKI2018_I69.chr1.g983.t1.cds [Oikopleura dioica]|uniref:Oidioi.mRNA.OKI2018_I69.PAR.g12801.t1.cds n=1 Tax=Oikopleura dioica TaxID=34765 RepID=A0ABN7SQS0_OIKDI|nr:Oidioi.mRNA.OKI2018_I69.PAR.g12801.t1.cds [Oikopleura dioica]CAG5103882.1 Oidioi.mRNA.OKI2018_I69.chr1.g983.t1.cds [Oikopleura dioica]